MTDSPNKTSSTDLETGWVLKGTDTEGNPIRLSFGETQLRQSHCGLTAGRHPALAELLLDEESVSRRHFRIIQCGEELFVEDVNSLNGTVLDGVILEPFELFPIDEGQTLTAGRIDLVFSRLSE